MRGARSGCRVHPDQISVETSCPGVVCIQPECVQHIELAGHSSAFQYQANSLKQFVTIFASVLYFVSADMITKSAKLLA